MAELIDKKDREDKRTARKEKKDVKLGAQIASETEKAGVDLKAPVSTGPLGAKEKAEIDKRIREATEKDLRGGLQKFQQLYKAPNIETPKAPSEEQLKRSLRRERRAKLGDILTGLGRGFRGASVDPSQFRGSQIRKEREDQYTQYKEASKKSKQRLEEWSAGYAQKQIDYLESLKDTGMSDLKKQKIEAEIENIKTRTKWQKDKPYYKPSAPGKPKTTYTHQTKDGNWEITNRKNPYSDLYFKLSGDNKTIINELAKLSGRAVDESGSLKRAMSADETEKISNSLISIMFDIQIDDKGNQVAVYKDDKEYFLGELNSEITNANILKEDKQELEAKRDRELYEAESTFKFGFGTSKEEAQEEINQKYDALIQKADIKLKESEGNINSMLGGESLGEFPKTTTDTDSVTKDEASELRNAGGWEDVRNKAGERFLRNKSNPKELKRIN